MPRLPHAAAAIIPLLLAATLWLPVMGGRNPSLAVAAGPAAITYAMPLAA